MMSRLARLARAAILSTAALAATPLCAQERAASDAADPTLQPILACLARGQEIVMAPKLDCAPYGKGSDLARKARMPIGEPGVNWDDVCHNRDDPRRLRPDLIKRIATQKEVVIAPTGIRIIGAVFCGDVDLVGLDLPYSLVLDRSVVTGVIDARNLRTKGDFSFENAIVLQRLLLNRARVEGSVYGNGSFMDQLLVNDTQVASTWWQSDSIILSDAHIHRTGIAGDLRLNNSAFTRLWILSSQIGGSLLLDDTEARCAYHINSTSMGYFTANGAGFGQMQSRRTEGRPAVEYPWWDRALSPSGHAQTKELLESPAIKRLADAKLKTVLGPRPSTQPGADKLLRGCEDTSHSAYMEFYLFDSTVRTAFCLTAFSWLEPETGIPGESHPVSILALDGTKVTGKLIIDLWQDPPVGIGKLHPGDSVYKLASSKNKFEAIGVSAAALIYDFADSTKPYFTYIDGLTFDRIHKAVPACRNDLGAQLATQVELPSVDEALAWLNKNAAPSSQPFTAFVAAFERAGEGATDLRIRRQTYDLCEKTARWFPMLAPFCPRYQVNGEERDAPSTSAGSSSSDPERKNSDGLFAGIGDAFSATGELIMIGFDWSLYLLADHGLRPAKVVWSVVVTLLVFFGLFWLRLGIVGFEPKRKDDHPTALAPSIWPVSFLFLFDRLIPVYQIREEHYAISRVFRRASSTEIKNAAPGGPPYPMAYFGRKLLVWPGEDDDLDRAGKWLITLRVLGLIFTIFLLAAINALARG